MSKTSANLRTGTYLDDEQHFLVQRHQRIVQSNGTEPHILGHSIDWLVHLQECMANRGMEWELFISGHTILVLNASMNELVVLWRCFQIEIPLNNFV